MTQAVKKRTQIKYDKLIGRISDEYYYLQYVFDDHDGFKGATGSILSPVSFTEACWRRGSWRDDNELWKQAVADDRTTLGSDAWYEQLGDDFDIDEWVFDLSDRELAEDLMSVLEKEYENRKEPFDIELITCLGGGRCFKIDMEWDKLYNRNLWELIKKYES